MGGFGGGGSPPASNKLEHTTQEDTYWVDFDNGDNFSGDGSQTNPYASIQHILDNIIPDKIDHHIIIIVKNGLYEFSQTDLPLIKLDGSKLFGEDGFLEIRGESDYTYGKNQNDSLRTTFRVICEVPPDPNSFLPVKVIDIKNQKGNKIYIHSIAIRLYFHMPI